MDLLFRNMNTIKQISHLVAFSEVVHHGSFSKAADALGLTKSALSQQISQLEQELGFRLLNRTTRGISLTSMGQNLLAPSQSIRHQTQALLQQIQHEHEQPSGRFRITAPHSLHLNVVLPALEQFCLEFPKLIPELHISDHNIDLIAEEIDIAIRAGEPEDSGLRGLPIGTLNEWICASPAYLATQASIKNADQLQDLAWLAASWHKSSIRLYQQGKQVFEFAPMVKARTNTLDGLTELVIRHFGAALLPDIIARPLIQSGKLVRVLPDLCGPAWPLYSLHAYQKNRPDFINRFHQLIKDQYHRL